MSDNPPWYVQDENGEFVVLAVPPRLKRHPEIVRRGLQLEPAYPMKVGTVYRSSHHTDPPYVVKILDTDTEERDIYLRLLRDLRCPRNPAIPGELTPPEIDHPLLIMPALQRNGMMPISNANLYDTLGFCLQFMEGVEYLHGQHIAHLDLCADNVVTASDVRPQPHPDVIPGKLYIIDFGFSRQLSLGPGAHPAINLPPTQVPKPDGVEYLDPYSWDVYCAADVMREIIQVCIQVLTPEPFPIIIRLYLDWLTARERGCVKPCRCRPSARRARQVLVAIRWAVGIGESVQYAAHRISRLYRSLCP
ncbi:hypothetical protein FKP32DRAFT_1586135 [Trametes sanguinea]|nr:hypothetical protein FKP32DRAFT_1586135 [Trametes sanguinea]